MDLQALLKGRTTAVIGSQMSGAQTAGQHGSPKEAPAPASAASKGLPSLHVIEGANAESDVEEDPFAEFTVMDGLEDLDEMLAEQGPEASPTNVSHGIDPSESLVTAAAASARPGISDAMVSDGELPYAADDTQPTATGVRSDAALSAPAARSPSANDVPDEAQPNQYQEMLDKGPCNTRNTMSPLRQDQLGNAVCIRKPVQEALKAVGPDLQTEAGAQLDGPEGAPQSVQPDSFLQVDTLEQMETQEGNISPMPTPPQQPPLGTINELAVSKNVAQASQCNQPSFESTSSKHSGCSRSTSHNLGNGTALQVVTSEDDHVHGKGSQLKSDGPSAHAHLGDVNGTSNCHGNYDHGDTVVHGASHPLPVQTDMGAVGADTDADMLEYHNDNMPLPISHASSAAAEAITPIARSHCLAMDASSTWPEPQLGTDALGAQQLHSSSDQYLSNESYCQNGGKRVDTDLAHSLSKLQGGNVVHHGGAKCMHQEDQNTAHAHDVLAVQPDESSRELPPSTATSVDSRAALLSSFWETMSTDHAPEMVEEGNGTHTPAHAGHSVNCPTGDLPLGRVQDEPDEQCIADATIPEPGILRQPGISGQAARCTEPGMQHEPGEWRSQPKAAPPPVQTDKRQSLHLRTASLSPTLSSSPGDVLTTPCSFAPPQGEDNGMEVEQLDKCVPDTVCINKPGSILTGSMPHAIEEPASRRHAENTQALGLEGCQAEAVSGTEAPRTLTEGQPRDEMLQIQPSNEANTSARPPRPPAVNPPAVQPPLPPFSQDIASTSLTACPSACVEEAMQTTTTSQSCTLRPVLMDHAQVPNAAAQDTEPHAANHSQAVHLVSTVDASENSHNSAIGLVTRPAHMCITDRSNIIGKLTNPGTSEATRSPPNATTQSEDMFDGTSAGAASMSVDLEMTQRPTTIGDGVIGEKRRSSGHSSCSLTNKHPRVDMAGRAAGAPNYHVDVQTPVGVEPGVERAQGNAQQGGQVVVPYNSSADDGAIRISTGGRQAQPTLRPESFAACDVGDAGSAPAQPPEVMENVPTAVANTVQYTEAAPDYRKALAALNASLQEATISVEESTDHTTEIQVQSAILNHRWAHMLQSDAFSSPDRMLTECRLKLESVTAACNEAMAIALSHGW